MGSTKSGSSIITLWAALAALTFGCGSTENFTLSLTKTGDGAGTVTATGLSCGPGCTEVNASYESGTSVTLTAAAEAGSKVKNWTGCDTTTETTCTLKMDQNRAVGVRFELQSAQYQLTIQKSGSGSGTIAGPGIACGSDCSESYASGTEVTLVATPELGSTLASWGGCGTTNGNSCVVTMSENRAVTAVFTAAETIIVNSDIAIATTWMTGKVYQVTAPIDVTAPLTIQPGVVVALDPEVSIRVTSTIIADGVSPTTPIVFTSSKLSPAPGDWEGITLAANGSVFEFCEIRYAGANDKAALKIGADLSATIRNCVFAQHRTPTDSINAKPALDASEAGNGTVIELNLFYDNLKPLEVSVAFSPGINLFDNTLAAPLDPRPNKYNAVFVQGCGHVEGTIFWPPQTVPYVIGESISACTYVTVNAGAQLTIGAPGANAILKFFHNGSLPAHGTLVPNAIFTSIRDDARGGDTNGDGNGTAPDSGDWSGVTVFEPAVFDGAGFFYGGGNDDSVLRIGQNVSATVRNTIFGHNETETETIRAPAALDASEAGGSTIIEDNIFYENTVPLVVNAGFSLSDSNDFSYEVTPGVSEENKFQAVVMAGCSRVTGTSSWEETEVPIVIGDPQSACRWVTVEVGASLTLADGVILKFFPDGSMDIRGEIEANATNQIVFTSFRDDEHGGDTNADGSATAPAGGDWNGIGLFASGSRFVKAKFLYGGGAGTGDSYSVLSLSEGKSAVVTDSEFAHIRSDNDTIRAPAALDLSEASSSGMSILRNRFYDTMVPLAIGARLSIDDSNMFDSGDPGALLPSRFNGIVVAGCGHVEGTTTWAESDVPFVIGDPVTACNYMVVDSGGTLVTMTDVTMKFFAEGALFVNAGGTFTVGSGAYFTSIRDDYLTDTNGDESATVPAVGDWNGIKYYRSGADPDCDQSSYMHYNLPNSGNECTW